MVLSACRSGMSRMSESVFNGVAQNLIGQGIPAVVAMQYSISVLAASAFSEYFYRSLGEKESLAIALRRGQSAMGIEGNQWYRPVLYLRWEDNQGGQLFKTSPIESDTATQISPTPHPTHLSRQENGLRQALLSNVYQSWVEGVLNKLLYNDNADKQIFIEINLDERPNAVTNPSNESIQLEEVRPLPQGTKVIDFFDKLGEGRKLLILGEPGAGKTITLLELARDLINRPQENVEHLIPVVFNLSSWAIKLTVRSFLTKLEKLNCLHDGR